MMVADASGASLYIEAVESVEVAGMPTIGFRYMYGDSKAFVKTGKIKCIQILKNMFIGEIYGKNYFVEIPEVFNLIIAES